MKTSLRSILLCAIVFSAGLFSIPGHLYAVTFPGPELIAKPTDTSITVHVVADTALQAYFEYGTTSGGPYAQTEAIAYAANDPIKVVIGGLQPNTRYYYRMQYSTNGGASWTARDEHSFYTQRSPGSTFTFTIITDSHMNGGGGTTSLYTQTLTNANNDRPDFHFDLGDTFWMDGVTSSTTANQRYLNQRGWMGAVSHSAAIFLATGNHENEEGWNFDDANSKALLSVNARKRYYPSPITDGFYSGNDDTLAAIDGDHLREDYYAWEWGDALFVVIDPYHYTLTNPYVLAGGEDPDEAPASQDRWDWTLGQQQFNWFKQTIQNSNAKYKFVFAHHMLGGLEDFVRGGAAAAHMFEWGGYNLGGTTWAFDTRRPGLGNVPVHQLMVANGVNAFFYGHDHLYAYQKRDGIVYQAVPSAGLTGSGLQTYYQDSYTLKLLPSPGHLRITVSPTQAKVDYIATSGAGINDTYFINPSAPQTCDGDFDIDHDVDGKDLASLIANSVLLDVTTFAQNFGKTTCP